MRRSTLAYSTMCLAINALTLRGTETNLLHGVPERGDHSEPTCAEKIAIVRGLAQGEGDPDSLAALAAKEAEVRAQCEGLELAETESGMEPAELAQVVKGGGCRRGWKFYLYDKEYYNSRWACPEDEETWLGWWCYCKKYGHPDKY